MDGWALPDDLLRNAPAFTPRPFELGDLELMLSGAYAPLTGFLDRADLAAVAAGGTLESGVPWPVPVTLEVPTTLLADIDPTSPTARTLLLTDDQGMLVGAVDIVDMWRVRDGVSGVGGPVRRVGPEPRRTFQRLRLSPVDVTRTLPPGRVLGVFAERPLHRPQLAGIALAARRLAGSLVVLVPVGAPGPDGLTPEALVRTVLAARDRMPPATIVAVPFAPRGDEIRDGMLRAALASSYGATHVLAAGDAPVFGGGTRIMVPRELAYDSRDGQWRSREDVPPRNRRAALTVEEINDLLDRGTPLPEWHTPPAVARELARDVPPRRQRGLVVMFTGLPGAGKSSLARGVANVVAESGERTITLLDGDSAMRELAYGLPSVPQDGDRYVRRIGWVAAEAARHGGLVLCCPIAPHAAGRDLARQMARAAGAGFVLVHVATPAPVCAERLRHGRYATVRCGEASELGELGDAYETPEDADLVIDTSRIPGADAVDEIVSYLGGTGWLDPRHPG